MAERLDQARTLFERRIGEAGDFVQRCQAARNASINRPALRENQIEWVYETATIKLVVSAEQFLETTLGLYALGYRTESGFRPRRLRIVRTSLQSMLEVFRGDERFVGWNEPSVIIDRSNKWLKGGEPFTTTLSGASRLLSYLKKMRNVIVHESDDAVEKYEKTTRSLYGALPRQVAPGAQLIGPLPPALPLLVGANLFQAAVGTYRAVAQGIVP